MPKHLRYHLFPGRVPAPQELAGEGTAFRLSGGRGAAPARILDSFSGDLRRGGLLLVESGGQLHLFTPRAILRQPAGAAGLVRGLPDGPVRRVLLKLCPLRRLLPLAGGSLNCLVLRTARRGKPRGTLTVLTLGTASCPASLLADRVKAGKAARGLEARLRALGARPAQPAAVLALLSPGPPAAGAKPKLPLRPDQPAQGAAGQLLAAHLAAARRQEPGIISDLDTEFLHDYRIALRRCRALLAGPGSVLPSPERARLRRDLSALMRRTSRLRDLDVWLLDQDRCRARLPPVLHRGLDALFAAIRAERGACQRALAGHLCSAAHRWHMAALVAEAAAPRPKGAPDAQPIGPLARELILKRHRKLCRAAERLTADSPDQEVHALRIGCKKLRYQMELFAPLFPAAELAKALKPLKRLQERLGRFNDCAQQEAALLSFASRGFPGAAEQAGPGAARAGLAAGALFMLLDQEKQAARARLGPRLKAFASRTAQQRIRTLCTRGPAPQAALRRSM